MLKLVTDTDYTTKDTKGTDMSNLNIRNVDSDLKRDVKVTAASEGMTIQDWVIKVISERVDRTVGKKKGK